MGDELLDRAAFDDFAALFDAGELREVIAEWHADALAALGRIAAALERGDHGQIGELAHRAAGGALALGAPAIASRWERLRRSAESGGEVAAADLDELGEGIEATLRALDAAAQR